MAPQGISFVVSVFVARLVEPSAYGLIGMLAIFMSLGGAFTELAFSASLIQKRQIDADDETSVFYLNIGAGIVLTLVFCAISPWVARFFRQDILAPLLCAQSLTICISSFGIVQLALISRTMQFRSNAIIELISSGFSGFVGIGMALLGLGVWSLVGLSLSRAGASVVLLWCLQDWRPRGQFRMVNLRTMWNYSSKLLFASVIHRVVTNLYSVLVGRFYPAAELGLYTRANSFPALPLGIMTSVVQRVAFPLFSRHQTEPNVLLRQLRRQMRLLALGASVVLGMLAAVADELVPLLLGVKWLGAVPLLKIFCLGGVLTCVFPLHTTVLQAVGQSGVFLKVDLSKKAILLLVVCVAYRYGITALAWGTVVISVTDYVLSALPNVRLVGYCWRWQVADIAPPLLLSILSYAVVSALGWHAWDSLLGIIVVKVSLIATILTLGIVVLRRVLFADLWQLSRETLLRLRTLRRPVADQI